MSAEFRVLMIATNVEREPYPVYPIGAAIIAGSLQRHGIEVSALDFAFEEDPVAATAAAIADHPPDLIGLSLRAVDNSSSLDSCSCLAPISELISAIRGFSDAPVVVGGAGYTLFPELLLTELDADFGVVGEGEEVVVQLVDRLRAGADPAGIPGVLKRTGKSVVRGADRASLRPSSWPAPSIALFPVHPYLEAGGMASVQTKRGCPLDCSYCTYPQIEGRDLRLRDPAAVAEEVAALADLGVDYIFFVDNNFNIPVEHAMAVCAELAKLKSRPEWTAFMTPYGFRPEHADQIASAGSRSLEFGSESGAQAVLDGLGKHHRPDHIRLCDSASVEAGVTPAHYFIFGGPDETVDTVEESLELIDSLKGPVVATLGVRVYPGTRLHQRAVAEGLVSFGDDLLSPSFYFSPQVDPEELADRLAAYAAEHRTFILNGVKDVLISELAARLRKHGRRGPLWEFMRP